MKKTLNCILLISLLSGVMVMSGCGRKGPMEPPPSSMIENEKGEMVKKPRVNKPFILDALIR